MGRRVIRLAITTAIACLCLGCSVTPSDSTRLSSGTGPVFPPPDAWPERRIDPDPCAPGSHPPWIIPLGCFGHGYLYDMPGAITSIQPGWTAHLFSYLSLGAPGFPTSGSYRMTCGAGEWVVPGIANVMVVGFSRTSEREPPGTCLYLTGLMGLTSFEQGVIDEFADRGWRMIVMWPSYETFDQHMTALPIGADDRAAEMVALGVDAYLCEPAYAAEAVMRWVMQGDPSVANQPLVVIGSSLGAITAPTVVARLRSQGEVRVDAAVLVGGGTNVFRIKATSTATRDQLRIFGFEIDPADESHARVATYTPADIDRVASLVPQFSKLDPAHTAGALRDLPVLLLHAPHDRVVPAELGDDLYDRLARPERWEYAFGHNGLFFALPFEAHNIFRWVERAITGPRATSAEVRAP